MTTDPKDALPPRLDPTCTCVCHTQPGVMHFAPCCREADPKDAEIADRLQLIARSLPDGVSKKSCEMINAGGEAIARLLAEIARLHQQWEDQDAAWSERVAVLSAALAESEAAAEGALMILVQTQAERDRRDAQMRAEGMRKAAGIADAKGPDKPTNYLHRRENIPAAILAAAEKGE